MRCEKHLTASFKVAYKEPVYRALFLGVTCWLQVACAFADIPKSVDVPEGCFIAGSDRAEREYAYQLDAAAYGHTRTRDGNWYEFERARTKACTASYSITTTPITNAQYLKFVQATGHSTPDVDQNTWQDYGLVHPYQRTRKYAWHNGAPPVGRQDHPVVLVSYRDAQAYARWLSTETGRSWQLPDELQWERAVRGTDGNIFPWGMLFNKHNLNSHDGGPFDTMPVGEKSVPGPFGLLDGAGQVFEWILTPNAKKAWVKGGSWDDRGCGVCRPAARHSRPKDLKHILIGFRLVRLP